MALSFVDPQLLELQRQLAFDTTTRSADLRLKGERIREDMNLLRPFMERRFGQQMDRVAGDIAGRGFHGNRSGIMRRGLGDLAEEQVFQQGQFERQGSRDLEDIERQIQQLASRNVMTGAEGVRHGAGRASQRIMPF